MDITSHLDAILTGIVSAAATVGMLKAEVKHLWAAIARHDAEFKDLWADLKARRRT